MYPNKSLSCLGILLWVAVLGLSLMGAPIALPTHGGVTHFDLTPGAGGVVLPAFPGMGPGIVPVVGGPCVAFKTGDFCRFRDGLPSPSLWHWETEIINVNAVPVAFPVGFYFPNGGGPIIGMLGLAPGSTFYIDIHVQDRPPEIGPWFWWVSSGLRFPIGIDTSVTEDLVAGNSFPGQFSFKFLTGPEDSFVLNANLHPLLSFQHIPEPGTWGLVVLGLGLTAAGRRRGSRRA